MPKASKVKNAAKGEAKTKVNGAIRIRLTTVKDQLDKKFGKPTPIAHLARQLKVATPTLVGLLKGKGTPRSATISKLEELEKKIASGASIPAPPARGRAGQSGTKATRATNGTRSRRAKLSSTAVNERQVIAFLLDHAEKANDRKPFDTVIRALLSE
jgi:hypothetical protein